jgi:hypothetical protein
MILEYVLFFGRSDLLPTGVLIAFRLRTVVSLFAVSCFTVKGIFFSWARTPMAENQQSNKTDKCLEITRKNNNCLTATGFDHAGV